MSYLSVTHWASGVCFLVWFFSAKAVCCLTLYTAGPWGSWYKAPSLWLKQLLWTFKAIPGEHERTCKRCEDCECWLSQIFFPESRRIFLLQNFGTFKGTRNQGYLSAVAGLVVWVLRIHLSSLNKSPLPLNHLVTVHDIIDFFFFICVPWAAPSFFSLAHRLRKDRGSLTKSQPTWERKGALRLNLWRISCFQVRFIVPLP